MAQDEVWSDLLSASLAGTMHTGGCQRTPERPPVHLHLMMACQQTS